MSTKELTDAQWKLVGDLARQLRSRRVSANLVRQAMTYSAQYPSAAALRDWLRRLANLGETFASGKYTNKDREALNEVLRPVLGEHADMDWTLMLGWIARLMIAPQPARRRG